MRINNKKKWFISCDQASCCHLCAENWLAWISSYNSYIWADSSNQNWSVYCRRQQKQTWQMCCRQCRCVHDQPDRIDSPLNISWSDLIGRWPLLRVFAIWLRCENDSMKYCISLGLQSGLWQHEVVKFLLYVFLVRASTKWSRMVLDFMEADCNMTCQAKGEWF